MDRTQAVTAERARMARELHDNAEIAGRPEMAEGTVKTHVSRLPAKLELRSRVQASVLAKELGISSN